MRTSGLTLLSLSLVVACTRSTPATPEEPAQAAPAAVEVPPPAPPAWEPALAPPEVAPLVARADAAIADLQGTLGKRLQGRLAEAGPSGAVEVCAAEAQGLTAEVARRHGVELGRTSWKLRNPKNAPRPWTEAWLSAHAGAQAAAAPGRVVDLGDRVGVIRPIAVGGACVLCHGDPAAIDPATKALLAERYPGDAAVGFAEGDLRGAFWVEVPKAAPAGE